MNIQEKKNYVCTHTIENIGKKKIYKPRIYWEHASCMLRWKMLLWILEIPIFRIPFFICQLIYLFYNKAACVTDAIMQCRYNAIHYSRLWDLAVLLQEQMLTADIMYCMLEGMEQLDLKHNFETISSLDLNSWLTCNPISFVHYVMKIRQITLYICSRQIQFVSQIWPFSDFLHSNLQAIKLNFVSWHHLHLLPW